MNRYVVAFFSSFLLYSLLFALFVWNTLHPTKLSANPRQEPIKIAIIEPPVITPTSKVIESKIQPPTPKVEPKRVQSKPKKPKKVVQKQHRISKAIKKAEPKPEPKVIEPSEATVIETPLQPKTVTTTPISQPVAVDHSREKKLFLIQLKQRINREKHYPKTAVRRHIEGTVQTSFTLHSSGEISALSTYGAAGILKKAARKSIHQVLPITIPQNILSEFPMEISLEITFKLQS